MQSINSCIIVYKYTNNFINIDLVPYFTTDYHFLLILKIHFLYVKR
jgi:hypothetical protein